MGRLRAAIPARLISGPALNYSIFVWFRFCLYFSRGGVATAAVLNPDTAVDNNGKKMADRMPRFPARLRTYQVAESRVIEAADSFMARWHRNKEERSCSRHATGDADSGRMGKGGGH